LIAEMFSDTQVIETRGRHRLVSTLKTVNCQVINGKRFPVLQRILAETVSGGTLIFSNTREQCDELAAQLLENGYKCAIYRGDMDKLERRQNLQNFRDGTMAILISTDLAARGLDVENVDRVINYHLPREMKNYLHRAGRTARAGRPGTVLNLVTDRDLNLIKRLESIANASSPAPTKF
jgi:ATP-dependent RNA helicase RhlE